ncbi:MAG TPA: redox-sensitive transcriptional activator SoxR [Alphaproteobacteria bacterium]|nr:redox-sensitive transcriptional activator SoxR [Alphaproteobacteria bacterium]
MVRELTVGEAAARSGVSISALHFYERKGLIRSHRTRGNQRRYARDVLRRLALIQVAQELGISLAEVGAQLAALSDRRTPSRADWERISRRWAAELDRRLALLQNLRMRLAGCIGCGCLSIDRCAIFNPEDRLAAEGAGPILLRSPKEE